MRDNVACIFRAFDLLCGTFDDAREVVWDAVAGNSSIEPFQDQIGVFVPSQVAEHHFAREPERVGISHILVCFSEFGDLFGVVLSEK